MGVGLKLLGGGYNGNLDGPGSSETNHSVDSGDYCGERWRAV
jgi:hypothetical protein